MCLLPGAQELDHVHVPASLHLDSSFAGRATPEACVAVRIYVHHAIGVTCSNLRHFVRNLLPRSLHYRLYEHYLCLHWILGMSVRSVSA